MSGELRMTADEILLRIMPKRRFPHQGIARDIP